MSGGAGAGAGGASLWAALLLIGDELLSGRTRDVHLVGLARELGAKGIRIAEVRVVRDEPEAIAAAVRELAPKHRYLFTTGGIGPTHDDKTIESIALALGVPVVEDAETIATMERHYGAENMTPERRRMARLPQGGKMVACFIPGAPAVHIQNIFVLAGLPPVTEAQMETVLPLLEVGSRMYSESREVRQPESAIAFALGVFAGKHGGVEIGSYPQEEIAQGKYETQIVLRSTDEAALGVAVAELDQLIAARFRG